MLHVPHAIGRREAVRVGQVKVRHEGGDTVIVAIIFAAWFLFVRVGVKGTVQDRQGDALLVIVLRVEAIRHVCILSFDVFLVSTSLVT